jgi:hypothetical protein
LVIKEVYRLNNIDLLRNKLDLAEAFNAAYVGSKPDKNKANARQYRNWRYGVMKNIGKLLKQTSKTLWDSMTRKSKRI